MNLRNRTRGWALAVSCLATSALAENPPSLLSLDHAAHGDGLFLTPMVGFQPITLAYSPFPPSVVGQSVLPEIRVGGRMGHIDFAGRGGLSMLFGGGGFQLGLEAGFDVLPRFLEKDGYLVHGVAGASFNGLFNIGYASSVAPGFGVDLGVGVSRPVSPNCELGLEAGLRNRFLFQGAFAELSTGLYLSVTGTIFPEGPKTPPASAPPPTVPVASTAPPACSTWLTDGWLEPTQGTWQDDLTFDDKPGKQLRRTGPGAYAAELNMVQGKDALVFGVHHYIDRGRVTVDSRDTIVFKGRTNCPEEQAVKFRLRLVDSGGTHELFTSPPVGNVPLTGAGQPDVRDWEIRIPARDGYPTDAPFKFGVAGAYTVRGELLKLDGAPTGLELNTSGTVQVSTAPNVSFIPTVLTKFDEAQEASLRTLTQALADDYAKFGPDIFPVPPGGLPTQVRNFRNLIEADATSRWFEFGRIAATVAALNDTLASSAFLTGAGRVVVVLPRKDFEGVFGKGAAGMTVAESVNLKAKGADAQKYPRGATLSWKVMLVPSTETWDTVAHELLHTLPDGWADEGMQAECGFAYHNKAGPFAHGERITEGSVPSQRERKAGMEAVMGPLTSFSRQWITQCTYWHLVKEFGAGPIDPPVVLVRAFVSNEGKKSKGELKPAYTLMGSEDFRQGTAADSPWAFVVKNQAGAELGRFPFKPRFKDPDWSIDRPVASVVGRIPQLPGWAEIELVGPSGSLDKKKVSAAPPGAVFKSPAEKSTVAKTDSAVAVSWTATPADGLKALSSLYVSHDEGKTWDDVAFETAADTATVPLKPGAAQVWVKLIVTDGTRSTETTLKLTRAP